ncbi:MAG: DUF4412 domain-containing protein [Nitrospirae bacterium]|nr:DUF4412 domain-containing protein [Nitrospirota bacterium]
MRKIPMILLAVSTTLIFGSLSWAAEGMKQQESQAQYSADSSVETAKAVLKSKVYVVPGKERKEQKIGDRVQITIRRSDKGVMWMLMPEEKMYMEMGMNQGQQQGSDADISKYKTEKAEEVGKEVIGGHEATKYKVIMTGEDGKKFGGFVWVVNPGIQVKMDAISQDGDSRERIKMELTNLEIGQQAPALFEIPADYTKMEMPGLPGMGKGGMKGLFDKVPGFGR